MMQERMRGIVDWGVQTGVGVDSRVALRTRNTMSAVQRL